MALIRINSQRTDKKRIMIHMAEDVDGMSAGELMHNMNAPIRI